jgi:DNA replication and repair protein RecF
MYLKELSVVNYKNLSQTELQFSKKLNCFIGNNGVGKTNLLDCIYYLSFCKSYFNASDVHNVKHGEEFFVLQGKYERQGEEENIYCGLKRGNKKKFSRNKKEYKRLSGHIGLLPLVMISPSDTSLILGGSEERRKFIDSVISQFDRVYLDCLVKYNRALLQRNNLLKYFAANRTFDSDSLDVWDEQLAALGNKIHKKRSEFINDLLPIFQKYYKYISDEYESVELEYVSHLNDAGFSELLKDSLPKDRMLQYTSTGIHKDDLDFKIEGYPIKKLGSQGQKKTYLTALKLAQFEFIRSVNEAMPVLLLDDIFDKLDSNRVEKVVKLVADNTFGQIFITDTNREHLDRLIKDVDADYRIFKIEDGGVSNQ